MHLNSSSIHFRLDEPAYMTGSICNGYDRWQSRAVVRNQPLSYLSSKLRPTMLYKSSYAVNFSIQIASSSMLISATAIYYCNASLHISIVVCFLLFGFTLNWMNWSWMKEGINRMNRISNKINESIESSNESIWIWRSMNLWSLIQRVTSYRNKQSI